MLSKNSFLKRFCDFRNNKDKESKNNN